MSRHRSRMDRLGRVSTTLPPTDGAATDAALLARARAIARLKVELGRELSADEELLRADEEGAARDLDVLRRDLLAQGIDPDQHFAKIRAELARRAVSGR